MKITHPTSLWIIRAVILVLLQQASTGRDQTAKLHFLLSAGKGGFTLLHNDRRCTQLLPPKLAMTQVSQPCCPPSAFVPLFLLLFSHFTSNCAPCKDEMKAPKKNNSANNDLCYNEAFNSFSVIRVSHFQFYWSSSQDTSAELRILEMCFQLKITHWLGLLFK